jgi:hypothetical protein
MVTRFVRVAQRQKPQLQKIQPKNLQQQNQKMVNRQKVYFDLRMQP